MFEEIKIDQGDDDTSEIKHTHIQFVWNQRKNIRKIIQCSVLIKAVRNYLRLSEFLRESYVDLKRIILNYTYFSSSMLSVQ